jgi:hypothetical protein
MTRRTRFVHGWRLLAIAASAHACAEPPPRPAALAPTCEARIVVGFGAPAEAADVAALAASTGLRLTVLNRLLPDLYVVQLSADGGDAACAAALERLRRDPRVRAADLDARRQPNGG